MSTNQNIRTLSLFSGGGGLDIGFHKAGFDILACVEIDKASCETLNANIGRYLSPTCKIINDDITKLQPNDIITSPIDFIIGGPPCQSFSAIGRRAGGAAGTNDARGVLFQHYCRLVAHYQPIGFLFENVRGILSSNKGEDWKSIIREFEAIGYTISYRVLDTADFGVPQHRERLIMIGTKNIKLQFPQPTHGAHSLSLQNYVSALEAIQDLQDPLEESQDFGGKYGNLLREVPPGRNYLHFTKEMGHPNPSFAWRSRFSDFLYKADPATPVRTIVAKLGAYSGPFHWKNRRFTTVELKRLQSFPDDYELKGSINAIWQQIGNSVPPLFAEQLALAVKKQLFNQEIDIALLADDTILNFDQRKSNKAKNTKQKRNTSQLNLFNQEVSINSDYPKPVEQTSYNESYFYYESIKKRFKLDNLDCNERKIYKIITKSNNRNYSIDIHQIVNQKETYNKIARYTINFHETIGDKLQSIVCTLHSNIGDEIAIMWDSIEDCIRACSNYFSMMDVYGHFTEPYPTFSLEMEILTDNPSFPVLFAKKFSVYSNCSMLMPFNILKELHHDAKIPPIDIVQTLRSLRFDVRVNQTNINIPEGVFRCCYPFTINIDKQISVAWRT